MSTNFYLFIAANPNWTFNIKDVFPKLEKLLQAIKATRLKTTWDGAYYQSEWVKMNSNKF